MKYLLITALVLIGSLSFAKKRLPTQMAEKVETFTFDVFQKFTGQDIYNAVAKVGLAREGVDRTSFEGIIRCTPSLAKADADECTISRAAKSKADY